jgi:threonine/homoserine/homoserine lactone efflux protein
LLPKMDYPKPARTTWQAFLFPLRLRKTAVGYIWLLKRSDAVESELFWKGVILGFAIAAPVGPIGVLTIQRTISSGWTNGLATGLGAASADTLYGALAASGLTLVTSLLLTQQPWSQAMGGVFLCYLGIRAFRKTPEPRLAVTARRSVAAAYLSAFLLTLSNPITILSFVALFTGLGLAHTANNVLAATLLVLGVAVGSSAWWVALCSVISVMRRRMSDRLLLWINRTSGTFIVLFGLFLLLTLFAQ